MIAIGNRWPNVQRSIDIERRVTLPYAGTVSLSVCSHPWVAKDVLLAS